MTKKEAAKKEWDRNIQILKDDFVLVSEPDAQEVASIVLNAKGEGRTMKEFAEATGISAPTLSRIANGKISKPMSVENMLRIIEKSVDESSANFFALVRANGYISKSEQKAIRDRQHVRKTRQGLQGTVKGLMSVVVKAAFVDRGCSMDATMLEDNPGGLESIFGHVPKYDFNLRTEYKDDEFDWVFYLIPHSSEDYITEKFDIDKLGCQILRELSPIFMTDAWKPDLYADKKITFALIDRDLYEVFYEYLRYARFNNRFSICLLNTDTGRVEETSFETANKKPNESLFDLPSIMSATFAEDGVTSEIIGNDFLFFESGKEGDE